MEVISVLSYIMQIPTEVHVHNDFTFAAASEGNTGKVKGPKLTMNKVNKTTPNSHSFQQIYMTIFVIRYKQYDRFSHLPNMIGAI